MSNKVTNIAPFEYIHVLNKNTNITNLVCGPMNFAIQDNEKITSGVCEKMVIIPNLHYVIISNPVMREKDGTVICKGGNPRYRFQNYEIRTRDQFPNPFPLYPNEKLTLAPTPLDFVNANEAFHLKALLPYDDGEQQRLPGDEWLFRGPNFYVPCQEVLLVRKIESIVIEKNQAIRIKASKNSTDGCGKKRLAGAQYLVRTEGSYLLDVCEEFVSIVKAVILDDNTALHLSADYDFTDVYGIERKAGTHWLVTYLNSPQHICDVYETQVAIENRIVLGQDDFCVILNPFNNTTNRNDLGKMVLVQGETSFFLNPGEKIKEDKIEKVIVLTESEALLLQAKENFEEKKAGEKWMLKGPNRFIPPIEVTILEKRNVIPLDKNEGIYVRNIKTGEVKTEVGKSYLLTPEENLWKKELPENIEKILLKETNTKTRDQTRVVTYRCPFNSIMQIYNLKEKTSRIVFGPNLVMLEPYESFSVNSLSGATPKKSGVVETLYLKLGPIFSTDEFDVETVDHTRLKLRIAYNWKFDLKKDDQVNGLKIFTIRDFIGDLCLTLGSKIRSFIATMTFDDFHKNSDRLIKKAVFGEHEDTKEINHFLTYESGLIVTDVDIQSVTPSDLDTRNLLQQSVSLAIELATKTIKQGFSIQLLKKRQEFKGELDKLKMDNKIEFLKKEIVLNKLKIESEITEKTGLSRAQAAAQKEAIIIEYTSKKKLAEMDKQAYEVEELFELKKQEMINSNEYFRKRENQRVDIMKTVETSKIESTKFKDIMEALGQETLVEVTKAGPELQAKLLKGLNLEGYIITDGNNPINLFNIADSIVKKD